MARTYEDEKKSKKKITPMKRRYLNFKRRGNHDEGDNCPECGGLTDFKSGFLICSECGWIEDVIDTNDFLELVAA